MRPDKLTHQKGMMGGILNINWSDVEYFLGCSPVVLVIRNSPGPPYLPQIIDKRKGNSPIHGVLSDALMCQHG